MVLKLDELDEQFSLKGTKFDQTFHQGCIQLKN